MKLSQNFSKQGAALNFANETNAQRSADLCAVRVPFRVKRELQKILTFLQVVSGVMIYGTIGGMERGQPMGNVRYIFIFGLGIIGIEILKQAITALRIKKSPSATNVRFAHFSRKTFVKQANYNLKVVISYVITKACSERAFRTRKAYHIGKHQTVR